MDEVHRVFVGAPGMEVRIPVLQEVRNLFILLGDGFVPIQVFGYVLLKLFAGELRRLGVPAVFRPQAGGLEELGPLADRVAPKGGESRNVVRVADRVFQLVEALVSEVFFISMRGYVVDEVRIGVWLLRRGRKNGGQYRRRGHRHRHALLIVQLLGEFVGVVRRRRGHCGRAGEILQHLRYLLERFREGIRRGHGGVPSFPHDSGVFFERLRLLFGERALMGYWISGIVLPSRLPLFRGIGVVPREVEQSINGSVVSHRVFGV